MSQLSRAEKLTLCSDNSIRLYVCLQSWAKIKSQKIRINISLTFFCWTSLSFHRPFLVPHVMHIYNSWGSVGARSMISCPCAIIKESIINFTYMFTTESPSSLSNILLINHSINSRYSSLHWRVSSKPKIEFHEVLLEELDGKLRLWSSFESAYVCRLFFQVCFCQLPWHLYNYIRIHIQFFLSSFGSGQKR